MPHPDVQQYSSNKFGNRVGFWWVMEVLDRYNIRCSATLDLGVLEQSPEVREAMLERDWTFVNHGFYNTRFIMTYSEEQEREFLLALPVMLPLDDVNTLWDRRITMTRYVNMVKESFDTVYEEGADNGRLMVLNFRPWLMGQPFRTRTLGEALDYITRRQGVWSATGSEIAEWYRSNPPVPR